MSGNPNEDRFVGCVAIEPGSPGLGFALTGELRWQSSEPRAAVLKVDASDHLSIEALGGTASVYVFRAGRALALAPGTSYSVLDQD